MKSLSDAIIAKDKVACEYFLRQGADVNALDEYGFTPLIETAIVNDQQLFDLVLSSGAQVNEQDLNGNTPLHWAVENANEYMIDQLLKHKANPNLYNKSGQSVLTIAFMRQQESLKKKLYKSGADLNFTKDFINTKLLGHRFELIGRVDIVDTEGMFVEINYEGFFLEFSIALIRNALSEFRQHFIAKSLLKYDKQLNQVVHALTTSAHLAQYIQYQTQDSRRKSIIKTMLANDLLQIIPIAHNGHALTFIKYNEYLVISDRQQDIKLVNTLGVYRIEHPKAWNESLLYELIYVKKPRDYFEKRFFSLLSLKLKNKIIMRSQISGNCSWANVEASIPSALYLLMSKKNASHPPVVGFSHPALSIFLKWQAWDKSRELQFCIDSFKAASPAAKASKAALLAAILFQRLNAEVLEDVALAKRILPILETPGYEYVLESYKDVYCRYIPYRSGKNLMALIEATKDELF